MKKQKESIKNAEEKSLQNLVKELIQDDSSFAIEYKNKQKEFPHNRIDTANQKELEKQYQCIKDLLLKFQENYRQLFIIAVKESTSNNDRITARTYIEICGFFINSIQNIYLNPINYKLNQLNNKKSLRVAWIVAILSFIFALGSIILTYYYGKNPTPCSCCPIETEQTQVISEKENSKVYNDKALPLLDTINKAK